MLRAGKMRVPLGENVLHALREGESVIRFNSDSQPSTILAEEVRPAYAFMDIRWKGKILKIKYAMLRVLMRLGRLLPKVTHENSSHALTHCVLDFQDVVRERYKNGSRKELILGALHILAFEIEHEFEYLGLAEEFHLYLKDNYIPEHNGAILRWKR